MGIENDNNINHKYMPPVWCTLTAHRGLMLPLLERYYLSMQQALLQSSCVPDTLATGTVLCCAVSVPTCIITVLCLGGLAVSAVGVAGGRLGGLGLAAEMASTIHK